jgi:hypothetical protein
MPDRDRRGIDAARAARLRRARAEWRAYRRPGPNGRARLAARSTRGQQCRARTLQRIAGDGIKDGAIRVSRPAPHDRAPNCAGTGTYDLDVCADSFAEFLYGFSIENALSWALERAHSLEPRRTASALSILGLHLTSSMRGQ